MSAFSFLFLHFLIVLVVIFFETEKLWMFWYIRLGTLNVVSNSLLTWFLITFMGWGWAQRFFLDLVNSRLVTDKMPNEHVPDLFLFSSWERENILVLPGQDARSHFNNCFPFAACDGREGSWHPAGANVFWGADPPDPPLVMWVGLREIQIVIVVLRIDEIFFYSPVSPALVFKNGGFGWSLVRITPPPDVSGSLL